MTAACWMTAHLVSPLWQGGVDETVPPLAGHSPRKHGDLRERLPYWVEGAEFYGLTGLMQTSRIFKR